MLFEIAVTVSTWLSPPPALIPVRLIVCCGASSRIAAGLAIASSVGRSLTAFTVSVNVHSEVWRTPPTVLVAV